MLLDYRAISSRDLLWILFHKPSTVQVHTDVLSIPARVRFYFPHHKIMEEPIQWVHPETLKQTTHSNQQNKITMQQKSDTLIKPYKNDCSSRGRWTRKLRKLWAVRDKKWMTKANEGQSYNRRLRSCKWTRANWKWKWSTEKSQSDTWKKTWERLLKLKEEMMVIHGMLAVDAEQYV